MSESVSKGRIKKGGKESKRTHARLLSVVHMAVKSPERLALKLSLLLVSVPPKAHLSHILEFCTKRYRLTQQKHLKKGFLENHSDQTRYSAKFVY